jgi:hypothetical protein
VQLRVTSWIVLVLVVKNVRTELGDWRRQENE